MASWNDPKPTHVPSSADFTADREGRFKFICAVPGHEALGMKGSLTVGEAAAGKDKNQPGFELSLGVIAVVATAAFICATRGEKR